MAFKAGRVWFTSAPRKLRNGKPWGRRYYNTRERAITASVLYLMQHPNANTVEIEGPHGQIAEVVKTPSRNIKRITIIW